MTVVGAIQIAHVPVLPAVVAFQNGATPPPGLEGPLSEMSDFMSEDGPLLEAMRDQLEEMAPDVAVFFDSDHLNTFFLDHVPSIAVGVDELTSGPSDHPLLHPRYDQIPLDRNLGDVLHRGLVAREFDVARVQRFTLDHSIVVPLHFLTPAMNVPIVPIWVNGLGGVPIRSARARSLGTAVREILDEACGDKRVVLLSSGALSLDIGTPRVFPGAVFGIPAPAWVERAAELISTGDLDTLVVEATPEQFAEAGNASAELLNIIAVMSAMKSAKVPTRANLVAAMGHTYAVWNS
jgi:aromatic ring-opening dioxygenase catalytic subunit (LigB family)